VPLMEELFWRSFLMRWIQAARFEAVVPQRVGLKAVLLSTFVFVLAHTLWLAAALYAADFSSQTGALRGYDVDRGVLAAAISPAISSTNMPETASDSAGMLKKIAPRPSRNAVRIPTHRKPPMNVKRRPVLTT